MQSRTQLLTPSALRLDSRLPLELRNLDFQILPAPPPPSASSFYAPTAPPAHADGYARVQHGLTSVASSVYGPRDPQRSGPWSGNQGGTAGGGQGAAAGGQQKGDRGSVNVEVGVAAWGERVGQGAASEGGLRRGGKDRYIEVRQRANRLRRWRNEDEALPPRPAFLPSCRVPVARISLPLRALTRIPTYRRTIELAAAVKNTFEPVLLLHLYPRSSIDIYLQILENDGSVLQAAINATTLALISAGLPLSDYVCALTLASYPSLPPLAAPQIPPFELTTPSAAFSNHSTTAQGSGSTTLLDLVGAEEQALPNLTVAVLPRSGKVTLVNLETRVGIGRFEEMLRWGVEGAKAVQGAMEEAVRAWSASLAAPSKTLGALFPGMDGATGGGGDDDDMDL